MELTLQQSGVHIILIAVIRVKITGLKGFALDLIDFTPQQYNFIVQHVQTLSPTFPKFLVQGLLSLNYFLK